MNKGEIRAALKLFKGFVADDNTTLNSSEIKESIIKVMAPYGIIIDNINTPTSMDVIDEAIKLYGKDGVKWNQTFHKSIKTVLETPIEQLIAEQILHYFTTYGFESLNIYDKDLVYIPSENLQVPELKEDIPLIVIHNLTKEQLTQKIMVLLTSGIALSEETLDDIVVLKDYIDKDHIDDIKNREFKIRLYDLLNVVPKNNIEFFRYLIYKTTGSSLLIKNNTTIKTIKNADITLPFTYLNMYITKKEGYQKLAEIFLRYKDLFLAFKREANSHVHAKNINKIINKIAKLSKTYHKPLDANVLDNLTYIHDIDIVKFCEKTILNELDKITIFREIRIVNSIAYRLYGDKSIVYKIRNGKCFVSNLNKEDESKEYKDAQHELYNMIYTHLVNRLSNKLKDTTIYLPDNITYTAPTSEKQFCGNFPEGSYIEIPRTSDLLLGIHWTNLKDRRVDLDLHMQNRTEHFGWNSQYRSSTGDCAFSGDVTDAPLPNGATEVFYISKSCEPRSFLLTVNDYTSTHKEVEFDIVIANGDNTKLQSNYIIDPNNIIETIHTKFEEKDNIGRMGKSEMSLGFVEVTKDYLRFYFNNYGMTNNICTRQNNITKGVYEYIDSYKDTQLKLRRLLEDSGAAISKTKEIETYQEVIMQDEKDPDAIKTLYQKITIPCTYDLSIPNITRETIIKLLMEE